MMNFRLAAAEHVAGHTVWLSFDDGLGGRGRSFGRAPRPGDLRDDCGPRIGHESRSRRFWAAIDEPNNEAYAAAYAIGAAMGESARHVRLFRNGRNQAIRIPREFELEGDEAVLRKEGDRLIIEPVRKGRLLALLASLEPLEDVFPDIDEDLTSLDDLDL